MSHVDKRGFTIIELMLAMTFISVLLLGIAMTIIQIGTIYNRGMALKEVNQSARDIGADVRRTISTADAIKLDTDLVKTSSGGRLCLGTVSYIWNTGKAFSTDDPAIVWFSGDPSHQKKIRFLKVPDTSKIYCAKDSDGSLSYTTITTTSTPEAQELLPEGDHALNVYNFNVIARAEARDDTTSQQLYGVDYTIGSGDISAMNATQTACIPPGQAGSDLAYCNVQSFSLVIRAGSKV